MIEQLSNSIKFLAFFTESKQGKTGLTVTVDVYNPAGTHVVTAGSATELADGLYYYTLASGSVTTEGEYVCVFKTADSDVDQQHIPALWVVGRAGVEDLDAAISSRNATMPPTAASVASQVRTELTTELGRIDASISSRSTYAGGDTSGTTTLLARLTATRAGLIDNLDAAISTRLAASGYTAPDNASITALIARLTADRAALLDNLANLDTTISSRLADADYSVAPTVAAIRAEIDANSTKLDVAVSTRNATAPDNAGIAAIKAKTDNLPDDPAAVDDLPDVPSAASVASAVRAELAVELARIDIAISSVGGGSGSLTDEQAEQLEDLHDRLTAARAALLDKLDVGEAEDPVVVVPGAPTDESLCTVYGYLETLDNKLLPNDLIVFAIISSGPLASERVVTRAPVKVKTDSEGRIVDSKGNLGVKLQRNDKMYPPGSKYQIVCRNAGINTEVELKTDRFNIRSLIVPE